MKDKTKIIAAFLITISIFISGLLIGNLAIDSKVGLLNDLQNDLYTESLGFDTLYDLANENICDENSIIELNFMLTEFGNKITYLENEGIDLINLKNQYYSFQIKHFLIINKINNDCGKKYDTLLYFYGSEEDCNLCGIQGNEITKMKNEKKELMVYSFDYNSNYLPVKNLILKYNVVDVPSLVINGKKHSKFINYLDLKTLVDSN